MKIRLPIFLKLLIFTCSILVIVTAVTSYRNSNYFMQVSLQKEEVSSMKAAASKAVEVESLLRSFIDRIRFYSLFLVQNSQDDSWRPLFEGTLQDDADLVYLSLKRIVHGQVEDLEQIVKDDITDAYGVGKDYLVNLEKRVNLDYSPVLRGELQISNISTPKGIPLVWIASPLMKNSNGEFTLISSAYFRLDRFQAMIKKLDHQEAVIIDREGKIFAHWNESDSMNPMPYRQMDFLTKINQSKVRSGLFTQVNAEGKEQVISYARNNFGITAIIESPKDILILPATFAAKQSYYLSSLILIGALFLIFLFSHSFTSRIEYLLKLTRAIRFGDFSLSARRVIKQNDEMGDLAVAFDEMSQGLREREKMLTIMNKFHGASVAEQLMLTEVTRQGQRKKAIVFFSDIRGFTSFSESKEPEEVVEMLNEYFEVMVSIINKHDGIVDKFIGDAIMAVWGIPKYADDIPQKAMQACLEMREALVVLNQNRLERGKEIIMFGAGLHFGEVISGTVGSEERMEYTIIGDTVNTAARIEASTKSFGTDLLISESLCKIVSDDFILERAGAVEAKGKSDSMTLYKVRGERLSDGAERIVSTQYSDYQAAKSEKIEVSQ